MEGVRSKKEDPDRRKIRRMMKVPNRIPVSSDLWPLIVAEIVDDVMDDLMCRLGDLSDVDYEDVERSTGIVLCNRLGIEV